MNYAVRYDPLAEKQLAKLPQEISRRIVKKIKEVSETGRGIETIKEEAYGFKIRVGDYRVLLDITYNPHTLWIRYVDHRGRIYKRPK